MTIQHAARPAQRLSQLRRHYHPRQAQGRKQGFGKGSQRDHSAVTRHALQRRRRSFTVMKFAVVIVFNQPAVMLLRPCQPLQPSRQAHCYTGWIVMPRRQVNQPGATGEGDRAVFIQRHRPAVRACGKKGVTCPRIARILQPDFIVRIQQQQRQQLLRLLRTGQDDDLFRATAHTA